MIENTKNSWNTHWSNLNRKNILNRVFVFVRTNVIARDVAHSLDKYFPNDGIFLDSGCGTSQTSIRIPRRQRRFVAMDIADVIFSNHPPVIDFKVNGDVLNLPFKDNSVDGIWNVGLMEHFKPGELDLVLKDFSRVLKKGSHAVFFWPATYGPMNFFIKPLSFFNTKLNDNKGNMFPEEPSLLKSKKWVKEIVERNNLSLVDVKWSLRGGLIHHVVVVKKL